MSACLNSTTLIVDDSDATQITYTGDWFASTSPSEFNHTSHGTRDEGATATFVFNGTGVAVFGTIEPTDGNPTSTYVIDGSIIPSTFTANSTSTPLYQQLFYKSPTLQAGQHTLVVTSTGDPIFSIDFISYSKPADPSLTTMATPSNSAVAMSSTSVPVPAVTATVTVSVPLASATTGSTSGLRPGNDTVKTGKVPAAAIAVGTVGALGLIATAILVFFLCWRRRHRASELEDEEEVRPVREMSRATMTPFAPPPHPPLPPVTVQDRARPPVPSEEATSPSQSRPVSLPPYPPSRLSYPIKKIYDDPSYGYQVYDPTNPFQPSGSAPMTYDPFSSTPIHLGFPTQARPLEKGSLVVMNHPEYGEGGEAWADQPSRSSVQYEVPPTYRR